MTLRIALYIMLVLFFFGAWLFHEYAWMEKMIFLGVIIEAIHRWLRAPLRESYND